ncbi:MAG: hypothetical protein GY716_24450, partial [bacterium]|nr:hypothetical protein [bacterium]
MRISDLPTSALLAAVIGATVGFAPTSSAQCPGMDDTFEDNDTCATAVPIPLGLTTGLYTEKQILDPDNYTFQVPAGEILTIDCLFSRATGDINVAVRLADCAGIMWFGFSQDDNETVVVPNGTGAALDIVISVYVLAGDVLDCNTYDLDLTTAADPCASAPDDTLEDNDTCATAVPLSAGTNTGLFVSQADPDYYELVVPDGDAVTVDVTHVHENGNIDLFLYDPNVACGGGFPSQPLNFAISQDDNEFLIWGNRSGAPATVVLEVVSIVSSGPACNDYDLTIDFIPDPCQVPDDNFEDNDDCASAVPIPTGMTAGLFLTSLDADFYSVTVPAGEILSVDCIHAWNDGDINVYFWDPAITCGTGAFSGELASGITPNDNEHVEWINSTGADLSVIIEVATLPPTPIVRCNTY